MLDRLTRPLKDFLLNSFVSLLARFLSPNSISIISFIFALFSAWFIYRGSLSLALIFWALNRIFDGLDGAVARYSGKQSDFGGYLDIMLDFIIYAMLPLIFTLKYGVGESSWLALSIMLSLFYINGASWMYLSSLLEKRNTGASVRGEQTSVSMPTGLVEGTETIIIFTFFYLLPQHLNILFYIMSIALIPGVAFRLIWAKKILK